MIDLATASHPLVIPPTIQEWSITPYHYLIIIIYAKYASLHLLIKYNNATNNWNKINVSLFFMVTTSTPFNMNDVTIDKPMFFGCLISTK